MVVGLNFLWYIFEAETRLGLSLDLLWQISDAIFKQALHVGALDLLEVGVLIPLEDADFN